jgi:hypothetical protein
MTLVAAAGRGALAGAVGTVVLNTTAYLDMLVRGRPASELPDEAAAWLVAPVGIHLGGDAPAARSRRQALGALLGTAAGVGVGIAYGLARPAGPSSRTLAEGAAVGAVAMVATNLPMTASGLTDPRTWGWVGWLADVVPHLAYGLGAAAALRQLTPRR